MDSKEILTDLRLSSYELHDLVESYKKDREEALTGKCKRITRRMSSLFCGLQRARNLEETTLPLTEAHLK